MTGDVLAFRTLRQHSFYSGFSVAPQGRSVLCSLFSVLCSLFSVLCSLFSILWGAARPFRSPFSGARSAPFWTLKGFGSDHYRVSTPTTIVVETPPLEAPQHPSFPLPLYIGRAVARTMKTREAQGMGTSPFAPPGLTTVPSLLRALRVFVEKRPPVVRLPRALRSPFSVLQRKRGAAIRRAPFSLARLPPMCYFINVCLSQERGFLCG